MQSLTINGVTYRYRTGGDWKSDAQPLLLLHGFTGSSANWAEFMQGTAHPTIAVDLLGHGETTAPAEPSRYAMERAAADLSALIEEVCRAPVHLLGYSMGGRLALYCALARPTLLQSLILESASPGLQDADERAARRRQDEEVAYAIEREGIDAFVGRWERLPLFASQDRLPAAARGELRRQRLNNRPLGLANSLRGMGTGMQPSLWNRLADVALPTLLITGALDEKFCRINAAMAQHMAHAQHVTVAAAGHTVHLEQPAAFAHQVTVFLSSA